MCIKDEYRDWHRKEMDFGNFKGIVPLLKDVQSVVLEGWGESLLYKHLIECILLVRREGAEVGFVTSGMGLTGEYAKDLIAAGIDFIGFSLSGATSGTHNAIRVNSDFDALINSIMFMKRLTAEKGMTKPAMHIVYLMLRKTSMRFPLSSILPEQPVSGMLFLSMPSTLQTPGRIKNGSLPVKKQTMSPIRQSSRRQGKGHRDME